MSPDEIERMIKRLNAPEAMPSQEFLDHIYPEQTEEQEILSVSVEMLSEWLLGAHRYGFFDGVAAQKSGRYGEYGIEAYALRDAQQKYADEIKAKAMDLKNAPN